MFLMLQILENNARPWLRSWSSSSLKSFRISHSTAGMDQNQRCGFRCFLKPSGGKFKSAFGLNRLGISATCSDEAGRQRFPAKKKTHLHTSWDEWKTRRIAYQIEVVRQSSDCFWYYPVWKWRICMEPCCQKRWYTPVGLCRAQKCKCMNNLQKWNYRSHAFWVN